MNLKKTAIKRAISKSQIDLRSKLWPKVKEKELWVRTKKQGFTTIPRTMPLFMEIMDGMSNKKPVSKVYFELWCRAFDEHLVKLSNKEEMAFHCGFSGQRKVQTWNNRIDILNKLGFIKLAAGAHGARSFALILNPYNVIKRHYAKKTPGISESLYNALIARAHEIKADDI